MKRKKLYLYEVGVPVTQLWVFRVTAKNRKSAYRFAKTGTGNSEQVCTLSGRKYVKRLRKATEEDL